MTFNGISWGYVDCEQAIPYSYNAQRILRMLNTVSSGGGNLLLNIGPTPDGSVPPEAVHPLETVGRWLAVNGACAYGKVNRQNYRSCNGVTGVSAKGETVYLWNWIWPKENELIVGGFTTQLKRATILSTGQEIEFCQKGFRIFLKNLPACSPDAVAGVAVLALEFEKAPEHLRFPARPAMNGGRVFACDGQEA